MIAALQLDGNLTMSASLPSADACNGHPLPEASAASAPSRIFSARLHTGLDSLAPQWRALQQSGVCTVYQRLEWVEMMLEHLVAGSGLAPVFVEILDSHQATAMILPLALRRGRSHSELGWLSLGVCDYAAPLVAAGLEPSAAEMLQIWQAAMAALPRVDLLHVAQIRHQVAGLANPLALLPGIQRTQMQCFGVALTGEASTLLQRICNSSTRSDIKRRSGKLAKVGEARFVAASTEAEMEAIFAAMIAQRRQRFSEMGRADLLKQGEVEDFYHAAARRGLRDGITRVFGISVNGIWIATSLGLVHNGAFHGIILAMSGEWKAYSPGIRIATDIMVWSRSLGLDYFDLTVGALAYKASLGAEAFDLLELAQALTWRGSLVVKGRRLVVAAKARLKQNPQLFEPLRQARRALRRWNVPMFRD